MAPEIGRGMQIVVRLNSLPDSGNRRSDSFLAGVGPIYVARWIWWRVRARTSLLIIR